MYHKVKGERYKVACVLALTATLNLIAWMAKYGAEKEQIL